MSEHLPATQPQPEPFGRMLAQNGGINVGAVAIESERAIAEAQGKLTLAKRFPRSMSAAIIEFMDACNNQDFAATAFYSVPNRGSGPSIRFAEEAARCYGNFVYGHRELSRTEGKSEIEVYAWDMEKNNESKRQITVMHVTDTKNGPKKLVDQADIDNKIANVASKQMRVRIMALMPKHMIAAGVAAAKRTLAGNGERPLSERILAMAQAFGRFGVSNDHLVAYLGHAVDNTTIDELADMMGIYNAIKEGAKASEYFPLNGEAADANASTGAAITANAKALAASAKAAAPAAAVTTPATTAPAATARTARRNPAQAEGNAAKEAAGESTDKPAHGQAPAEAVKPTESKPAAAAAPAESQDASNESGPGPDEDDVF